MWGRREFLESSSSDELSPKPFQSISTDVSNNPPVKFIAKPPPTRPITANARIMSIQRAKLLDRGTGSIRVQVSPFYRTSSIEITQSPPQISKKPPVPNKKVPEDLEEIKVADLKTSPKKNPKDIKVKDFLSEEKPENNSKEWLSQTKTFEEIAPQPTYQRVKLQSSTSLRARPQSQITVRSNSKEFKTITTVSVKKPIPPSVKQHSVDQKNNLFAPVPLGSKLFCIIKRNNQEVYQQYPKYSVVLASNGIQVMSASRVRGKYGGNYVVSLSDKDFSKNSLFFLGEVKTEAGHRSMSFFRFRPKKSTVKVLKKQDGTVIYENESFHVLIPSNDAPWEALCKEDSLSKANSKGKAGITKLIQRTHHSGRGSAFIKSQKNFEITDENSISDCLKFEKLRENTYKIAICQPFSAFQAMGVLLSRFEKDVIKNP